MQKLPKLKAHQILHGFQPRDNGSQHKHLCSIFQRPSLFVHSKPVSIVASSSPLIKTQQSAFHISQTWVHKPLLAPSTLFSPLKNKDTSRQSCCIKSICRLNLLQGEVQIRPGARGRFLLPCSKTFPFCLLSSTACVPPDGRSSSRSLRLDREHLTNKKSTFFTAGEFLLSCTWLFTQD